MVSAKVPASKAPCNVREWAVLLDGAAPTAEASCDSHAQAPFEELAAAEGQAPRKHCPP